MLFDVGDDAEDAEDDPLNPPHNDAGHNGHVHFERDLPPPYTTDDSESTTLHKAWAEETGVGPPVMR